MNISTFFCKTCGRLYLVTPTGNLDEWHVAPYLPEARMSMEPQPPTVDEVAQYVLTGEYTPQYAATEIMIQWKISDSKPFCPLSECLGELEETFIFPN